MTNERTVTERVRELLFTFGKLGLLIEDAPDARLRTARELYGTDGLPLWWLRFDNLEEGTEALTAAWRAVARGEPEWARGLPLLVVLDRYLKESATSSRAVAWDENEDRPIVAVVREILAADKELPVHLKAVTSYSGPTQGSKTSGIVTWNLRHHEPLYQLRRRLAEGTPDSSTKLLPLLFYGPVEKPPVLDHSGQKGVCADGKQQKVALCRAQYWRKGIDALIEALDSTDPGVACVLLTGAGASLANDPFAPGIPDTWYLLEHACWEVTGRPDARRPVWPPGSAASGKPAEEITSLKTLLERYQSRKSVRDFDWALETLFNYEMQDPQTLRGFASAFRLALQLWDHDFPYQSWLLSQLPWTLILTTNFDGFHERAAANAVAYSRPSAADLVRRLGDAIPVPDARDKIPPIPSPEELMKGPGLLKPYGSLMTMGPLALAHRDFWSRIEWVSEGYIQPIMASCTELWIVVVGHRLASDALNTVLSDLLKDKEHSEKLRILWVEPYPYGNENLKHFECLRRCLEVLEGKQVAFSKGPVVCPLPARALDFAFDLWSEWNRLSPRSLAGNGR